jgi:hypothetical protein
MEPTNIVVGRVRRRTHHRTARGLYRPMVPGLETVVTAAQRAAARRQGLLADLSAWSALLHPTQCFTHLSSAIARDWWLPPRLPAELPIWIAQISGSHASTRQGVRVISSRAITPSERVHVLLLAEPAETLVSCAIDLSLLDLLILIDCALHRGEVTIDRLMTVAAEHRRGAPRLRQAIALADGRSESAMETVMRVLHVACGVDVIPQFEVRDSGRFVARGDLLIVGSRSMHEYDGDDHLDVERQRSDLRRSRKLLDAGYVRRGFTLADLATQPHLIIREACVAAGRPFALGMLAPWRELWDASTFSRFGLQMLRERLTGPRTRRTRNGDMPRAGFALKEKLTEYDDS